MTTRFDEDVSDIQAASVQAGVIRLKHLQNCVCIGIRACTTHLAIDECEFIKWQPQFIGFVYAFGLCGNRINNTRHITNDQIAVFCRPQFASACTVSRYGVDRDIGIAQETG